MAITPSTDDLAIIAALDDEPNDVGGLTATQLKAKFDDGAEALQTYINDTLIPELDAAHLPYIYGAATTIKAAMEALVAGVVPDDSITAAMLKDTIITLAKMASSVYASQAEAEAGAENTKFMTALRARQAIEHSMFPVETLTATWNQSVNTSVTVTKTIAHTLGAVPTKIKVFFVKLGFTGCVTVTYDGTNYNYEMSGHVAQSSDYAGGTWKKTAIADENLFGPAAGDASFYCGAYSLGGTGSFTLDEITMTDTTISFPITNTAVDAQTLASAVTVEVYA